MIPRALEFILEAIKIRGIFAGWLLFKILNSDRIYFLTKTIAFGVLAMGCGLEGRQKKVTGFVGSTIHWLWSMEPDPEEEPKEI